MKTHLNRHFPRSLLLMMPMAAALLLGAQARAAQAAPVVWAKWILDVSFDNGAINVARTGQIYANQQLTQEWVDSTTEGVVCTVNNPGGVAIGADAATFSGGFLTCQLPSFRQSVLSQTNNQLDIGQTCSMSGRRVDFWLQAEVSKLDFSAGPRLPLAAHSDWNYDYSVVNAGGGTSQLDLNAGPMSTTSATFPTAGAASQNYGSRIHPCNGTQCQVKHRVDGTLNLSDLIAQGAGWFVTNENTSLTVGTDGANFFRGELHNVRIDPGCVATSG